MQKYNKIIQSLIFIFLFCYPVFAGSYQAVVVRVSDGDTVWVRMNARKIKLRMLGIDTPEKFTSKKLQRDAKRCNISLKNMKILGKLATRHAKTYLRKGQIVRVITYGRGHYGRTLATIILSDGTNFNERMVRDGYACVYKHRGRKSREISWNEFYKLNKLMEEAKRQKKGLWSNYYDIMDCLCR